MRRILIILGCVGVAFLAVIIALVVLGDPKARVGAVQKRFTEMPNVKIKYISDLTKQASQVITADLAVAGKGEMSFTGLSTSSFGDSSHIRLSGIGPYRFRMRHLVGGKSGVATILTLEERRRFPQRES